MKNFLLIWILSIFIGNMLYAQKFEFRSINPFNFQLNTEEDKSLVGFQFADIDNDDDYDIIYTGYIIDTNATFLNVYALDFFQEISENIGTKNSPQFDLVTKAFNNIEYPKGLSLLAHGDLNDDEQLDFIASADNDTITGLQSLIFYFAVNFDESQFSKVRSEELNLPILMPRSILFPVLIDLDRDGDLDLFLYGQMPKEIYSIEYKNTVLYAENVGTPAFPNFLGWFENPYHIKEDTLAEFLSFGDLDLDGDVDVISFFQPEDEAPQILFKENEPDENGNPSFLDPVESPFGLPVLDDTTNVGVPTFVDLDGDGDLDLFIAIGDDLQFYENVDCVPNQSTLNIDICEGESYILGEIEYYESGEYQDVFQNLQGCDSTVHLSLNILEQKDTSITMELCSGDQFVIGSESFSQSGDYNIILIDQYGCDSTVHLSLNILEENDTSITMDICSGDQIVIGSESFSQSGDYNIILADQYGCDSSIHLTLNVHEIDQALTMVNDTLYAIEGYSAYQWYDCNTGDLSGASQSYFIPNYSGNFGVRIVDAFGCESNSECIEVVVSSILEQQWQDQLELIPNPASNIVSISSQLDRPIDKAEIYDLSGRVVLKISESNLVSIDINHIKNGIYWTKLYSGEWNVLKKLLILKH